MAVADAAPPHADVFDTVEILKEKEIRKVNGDSGKPDRLPAGLRLRLTLRVTVGSLWALEIRWPSRVLVRRNARRMLVALVKSCSTGE